jgi:mobilization protein NikA
MARPRKLDHERRSEVLYIRQTPDGRAHVDAQAAVAGLTPQDYARRILESERVSALPASAKAAKAEAADLLLALDALTGQTKRIGNNVNQLAAAEHRGSDFVQWWAEVGTELKTHLNEIEAVMAKVSERL